MVKILLLFIALAVVVAEAVDPVDHSKDPSFYRCPFRMFDSGLPVTLETGEVQYCDVEGVACPKWHFCSAGYEDGRSVCCHILAFSVLAPVTVPTSHFRFR